MSIDEAFDIDLDFGPLEDNRVDFEALASRSSSVQPCVQKQYGQHAHQPVNQHAVQRPYPCPTQSRQQGAPTEQKNHAPHLPSEEYLDDVHRQQKAGPTKEPPHNDQGDTAGYDEDHGQSLKEVKSKNKRKVQVLKENHDNPSLIGYYPTLCTAMLEMEKCYFRQHVVLVDPFPARLEALSTTCDEMVDEALTMFMTLNRKIEDGYWLKCKDGMARVLWNDLNMLRSELCAVAQGHLASKYNLRALSSAKTKGEWIKVVKDKVEKLTKGFLFLRGENDSNWKTSNFAHPGLQAICITAFYHSGSKSFCNHPEFKAALPYSAMLLVASLVKGYLDIYREHGYVPERSQVPLIKNKKDYFIMRTELQRVLDHPYHEPKLVDMLERWAEEGMTGFELDEGAGEDEECKIVLD
ncbi:hypothetical protein PAXINDRAFT_15785 [Paxillus involutus ATCC 200175]|uniref:DUF6532 domain-containing protein n=1 Tax=Paxillus involutus ATCC 200175 TaxID=664439 RepID=A0A0C9TKW0_PAXIN|nr:hypothetical protein PAXINDRAFT_15785 [Paxillus involutus ATCC 200175]